MNKHMLANKVGNERAGNKSRKFVACSVVTYLISNNVDYISTAILALSSMPLGAKYA